MRTNLSLRLLLADKDKEIEQLKKELTEEKNAYIKMYNMYVEKDNVINELEKEIDRLLERQYESEKFAKEQGFDTYLPAKENLLCVKNKLQELKGENGNE